MSKEVVGFVGAPKGEKKTKISGTGIKNRGREHARCQEQMGGWGGPAKKNGGDTGVFLAGGEGERGTRKVAAGKWLKEDYATS